jgi:hypothetical protein
MFVDADHNRMVKNLYRRNPFIHPSVMMRKDAFLNLGGYDESLPRSQDQDLWLRASSVCRFANIPEPLLLYKFRPMPHWNSIYYASRVTFRAIKRDKRPFWYYYYALRYFFAIPLYFFRKVTPHRLYNKNIDIKS